MTKTFFFALPILLAACVQPDKGPSISPGSPYKLSDAETYTVRDYVSSKFHLPRAVHMHPMSASRNADGVVTVCGLADAIGQEGPGEAIGYRPYTGILIPQNESFFVTKIANDALDDLAIQRLCKEIGAPIVYSDEVKRFMGKIKSG